MNELNINMLSESELKELLDIRTQITSLQKRYDEIMRGSSAAAPSAIAAPVATPAAAEIQHQPYQAAPLSAVAAPVRPAPTPITARPSTPSGTTSTQAFTPSRPQAPRPAPVSAKPVTPVPAPRSIAAASTQKAEEAEKIKVDSSIISNVRQALVQILTTAAKPLQFNSIYAKLQDIGVQLPESKPMLVVRKLLYEKELFDVVKGGLFQIRAGLDITDSAAAADQPQGSIEADPAQVQPDPDPMPQQPHPAPVFTPTQPQNPKQTASFNARLDAILNQ